MYPLWIYFNTLSIFQQITGYVEHVNQQQISLVNDGIALVDRLEESYIYIYIYIDSSNRSTKNLENKVAKVECLYI